MKKTLSLIALSGVFLASCTQAPVDTPAQVQENNTQETNITLDNTKWDFPAFNGELNFEDGKFSANAGCNSIFGGYEISGNNLSFKNPGSTMMLCDEDTMKNESDLIEFLQKVETVESQEDRLVLKTADNQLSLSPAQIATLSDTKWNLSSMLAENAMVSHESFENAYIEFTSDFGVNGQAMCNNFTGEFSEDEEKNTFTIGTLASTKKLCIDEEANKYESQMLADLQNISQYEISRDSLTLSNTDDSVKLIFTAE